MWEGGFRESDRQTDSMTVADRERVRENNRDTLIITSKKN